VIDIDGVVADVRHRLHFLSRRPKDWGGFFQAAGDDPPLPTGLALVADLAERADIVWLTGRPEGLTDVTRTWLARHGLPTDELHLRGTRDRRPAVDYKLEVLRRLSRRQISALVDDDPAVIRAAQGVGYPAILADWVPREDLLTDAQERRGRT
jgi:uncharacterized HAD superfamily protein